jgi:hypothetical protein
MKSPILQPQKYEWYIGIDTGMNTGWAIWNAKDKKFLELRTTGIHLAMQWAGTWATMRNEAGDISTFFRVEDSRQATFGRQGDAHKLRGAGSVMRDGKIWEDYLTSLGARFEMVRPNPKLTKLSPEIFAKTTGWTEKCSSHARDAAMLVYDY